MHASHNDQGANEQNVEVGLGLLRGENGDMISANLQAGMWDNDGAARYGARGDAQLARGHAFNQDWGVGVDGGVMDAAAEASLGGDGFTLGATANAIDGAVTFGGFNADDSWADSQARIGASYGVGAAARGHWGDSDGDGVREIGLGADIPTPIPGLGISFDVKSEALGHVWNGVTEAGSAIAGAASDAWDWLTD